MTVRPIVQFPDLRLHVAAEPVVVFDDGLRGLATDLFDTMRAAPGIGITAPHIGVLQQVVVLQLSASDVVRTYINPKIVWASSERLRHQEGSVSMPGIAEEVERFARVHVAYQDLDGAEQFEEAEGLLAVCHQHEIDQLAGVFWIERLSRLKRERLVKRYEKALRGLQA